MERLTIKELAPYLSYGLNFKSGNETWLLTSLRTLDKYPIWAETRWNKKENKYKPEINNRGLCIGYGFKLKDIKPLLRPLSSLTEVFQFGDYDTRIEEIVNECEQHCNAYNEWLEIYIDDPEPSRILQAPYEVVQELIARKYDVFNLIPRGLSIPIDGKEVEGE